MTAATVVHPGPTLGYRVASNGAAMAYSPDHEPALAGLDGDPVWTSGYDLAADVDLLLHDGQYSAAEYAQRVGWGHSSTVHAVAFAELAGVHRLALFHDDPDHDDGSLDRLVDEAKALSQRSEVVPGCEGTTFDV
ncbi:MAG TPA: MBL fold metallo-hydrolase [Candidatus Limnocylindrales bacterium]|nr:MBL fold metallo-hydrolase [Candidatus Limnocylindrales bacterium]